MSQDIIFFGFLMPMIHSVNKKTPPSASPTSLSPTRFACCFTRNADEHSIAVIRLFAKDNAFLKKKRFFLLTHCWSAMVLLFCLYVVFFEFFTFLPLWNYESKAAVVLSVSEETRFEGDTNSIILGYLYHSLL